jgi:hypothetical protein
MMSDYMSLRDQTCLLFYVPNKNPQTQITGTGKLILHSACKARVLIQAQTIKTSKNTEKVIIPSLSLEYDCCVSEGKAAKLDNIQSELPMKSIVHRLEDLSLAATR